MDLPVLVLLAMCPYACSWHCVWHSLCACRRKGAYSARCQHMSQLCVSQAGEGQQELEASESRLHVPPASKRVVGCGLAEPGDV